MKMILLSFGRPPAYSSLVAIVRSGRGTMPAEKEGDGRLLLLLLILREKIGIFMHMSWDGGLIPPQQTIRWSVVLIGWTRREERNVIIRIKLIQIESFVVVGEYSFIFGGPLQLKVNNQFDIKIDHKIFIN